MHKKNQISLWSQQDLPLSGESKIPQKEKYVHCSSTNHCRGAHIFQAIRHEFEIILQARDTKAGITRARDVSLIPRKRDYCTNQWPECLVFLRQRICTVPSWMKRIIRHLGVQFCVRKELNQSWPLNSDVEQGDQCMILRARASTGGGHTCLTFCRQRSFWHAHLSAWEAQTLKSPIPHASPMIKAASSAIVSLAGRLERLLKIIQWALATRDAIARD